MANMDDGHAERNGSTLTGDHMSGVEAVASGMANRAFPEEALDNAVLEIAKRISMIPNDLLALTREPHIELWKPPEYGME
ncbi:MAG: hypothetical protein CM15mP49_16610 [Actinomycetota bacterium]|nr:MAG: hypothetical protein CM15mP49_16610 [Actinomycetota bacterium]